MMYMKKLFLILLALFISGCHHKSSAVEEVEKFLNNYICLSNDVIKNLNDVIDSNEDFNKKHKKLYKKIMTKQYQNLKYTILSEKIDKDIALINVSISVYDLTKAEDEATNYLSKNLKEFYNDNDEFDNSKYISYKLKLMHECNDRVDYQITFSLKKVDNEWILEQPTNDDLEKIHGIYLNGS